MTYWLRAASRIVVGPHDRGVMLPITDTAGLDLNVLALRIRRRGSDEWLLTYPAWDRTDDGKHVFFLLDSALGEWGRFEARVEYGGRKLGTFEIDYRAAAPVSARMGEALEARPVTIITDKPTGATDMYDPVQTFSATLTEPLARADVVLPLSETARAALCNAVIAQPVQLVITDGVQHEIVEFTACQMNQVVVTRARAGTLPRKFPAGATVQFSWTVQNVANAR